MTSGLGILWGYLKARFEGAPSARRSRVSRPAPALRARHAALRKESRTARRLSRAASDARARVGTRARRHRLLRRCPSRWPSDHRSAPRERGEHGEGSPWWRSGLELPPDVRAVALSLGAPDAEAALRTSSTPGAEGGGSEEARGVSRRTSRAATLALERLGQRAPVGRNFDGTPAWPSGVTGFDFARWRHRLRGGRAESTPIAGDRRGAHLARPRASRKWPRRSRARTSSCSSRPRCPRDASRAPDPDLLLQESLFKCLFPLTREFMEFEDARARRARAARARGGVRHAAPRARGVCGISGREDARRRLYLGAERVESAVFLKNLRPQSA